MYPEWPKSAADLTPLPLCPGPTLPPFDFKGWQDIEFLEYLGDGAHAHVLKVRILRKIYALKLFRFVYDHDWPCPDHVDPARALETLTPFYHYAEPFSAECRAYGRLRESGHEELAIKCYGYLLLDDKNERALLDKFREKIEQEFPGADGFNGNGLNPRLFNVRGRFVGKGGKLPLIRGIVKEFGHATEDLRECDARRIFKDITKLQQLGIVSIDVAQRQLINGKFCDFSIAVTVPHFITTPALNPRLSSNQKPALELETFRASFSDFCAFDRMIEDWNKKLTGPSKPIKFRAYPAGPSSQTRYKLRNTHALPMLYSIVEPRRCPKNFKSVAKPSAVTKTPNRGHRARARAKSHQTAESATLKPTRLEPNPRRWKCYFPERIMETIRDSEGYALWVSWTLENGLIFPVRGQWYPDM